LICSNIIKLEEIQRQKQDQTEFSVTQNTVFSPKQRRRLISMVGSRPLIQFYLDGKKFEGLWDTGSMISLLDYNFVKTNFPNAEIKSTSEFLEDSETLDLIAANNTKVDLEGVVLLNFGISKTKCDTLVPFVVSSNNLKQPIIGFNLIEYLINNTKNTTDLLPHLKHALPNLKNPEAMIEFVQNKSKTNDFLGEIKTDSLNIIPANSLYKVKCKTRIPVEQKERSVMFSPNLECNLDNDLVIHESLVHVKKGRTPYIYISVINPSNHPIVIAKRTVIGSVHDISAIIPLTNNQFH